MGLLDGKRLLITGVVTEASLAYGVAERAQREGAEIILSSAGRALSITKRVARRLPHPVDTLEIDVTEPAMLEAARDELQRRWGSVDGVLHSVAFAPPSCLGGSMFAAPWDDVATSLHVSTYSMSALVSAMRPLLLAAAEGGGNPSVIGLDLDSTVTWQGYGWMGVAKSGLESLTRYLARELGADRIRVNLVAAGPLDSTAAKSIPSFEQVKQRWADTSPLAWDPSDSSPVAKACVALFSDLLPMTTGEILHVDGGLHVIGG